MTDGKNHGQITDRQLLQDIHLLRQLYDEGLKPRMYIYYDRFSMKEKETIEGYAYNKVRVTLDQNLTYRDEDISLFKGNQGTWSKARMASSYLRQTWFERAEILKIQLCLS